MKKVLLGVLLITCLMFSTLENTMAMHIMEGFLPPVYSISWSILCIPFIIIGFLTLKRRVVDSKTMIILAMCGAFAFILSALKIPSVTGSCSHMTGVGLAAILFGPFAASIIGTIVLVFQAVLLAHGGLTTLGANIFSMAVVGPFVAYGVYKISMKFTSRRDVSVFLGAALGDLATYVVTSVQLSLAFPQETFGVLGSLSKFLSIFALTQIPLGIIEGLITVVMINSLNKYAFKEIDRLVA
ncbi:MAG: energy-coupling factor ABC transporter permease [Clostridium sp.]